MMSHPQVIFQAGQKLNRDDWDSMKKILSALSFFFALIAAIVILAQTSPAQSSNAQRRITQAVDDKQLTLLKGNTHPFARPRFDQGEAPATLPMERMMLVLRRSPEQEAALEKLMGEQQDKSSPNYHHWLSPVEFGRLFGPSDEDIQTITSWLGSHGFQVSSVANGRISIEFSGDAGMIKEAFHTEIHKYLVNGEEHWANAADPQIPTALLPVVVGVNSMHNFPRHPMSHRVGVFSRSKETGQVKPVKPEFTFTLLNNTTCSVDGSSTCYAVGPADFAAIYHVQDLWNAGIDGTGQSIAIANNSNINISDAHNFRSLFGLPANDPLVIFAGADPHQGPNEIEADIDTQWTGAVAKGATIDLVIAADTNAQSGVDLAANFIIQNHTASILSESFGLCEFLLGGANANFNKMWQMAMMTGITVIVSTGDTAAAGCEDPNTPMSVTTGLAVNGIASTPFNVAVGGTDFNQLNSQSTFWNTTDTTSATGQTHLTAKGYIPETTWNDSCTNSAYVTAGFGPNILTICNNAKFSTIIAPIGGNGGSSNCTTSGAMISSCSGGYAQPCWQGGAITAGCPQHSGITTPGNTRTLPDISLFAGDGLAGSFYPICQQDQTNNVCNLNSPFTNFVGVGGTSVSTQAFAGIVALINQKKGSAQGFINPRLYQLAAQAGATCASVANPAAGCIFNDVTSGNISAPCVLKSPNCGQAISAQVTGPATRIFGTTGVQAAFAGIVLAALLLFGLRGRSREWNAAFAIVSLGFVIVCAACGRGGNSVGGGGGGSTNGVLSGFNAAAGYDRATGLGTVNAANLVNNW